jgi:outer membrane protein assembly factor BamB
VTEKRTRLGVSVEVNLGSGLEANPASTGEAVILATEDGRVRALSGRDLSPLGAWPLDNPRALGPLSASGHAFLADAGGTVFAFAPDGRRLWSIDLQEGPPIAPPVVREGAVQFLCRDGTILRRSLSDGSAIDRTSLGLRPWGDLWAVGPSVAVAVAPGTVRLLESKAGVAKAP